MRRGGIVARATTVAVAGFALALGGVVAVVAPAQAADFPDVDSEVELNAAIAYAVANPSDNAVVSITGDFSLATGIDPLTTGRLVVNGGGHTISSSSVLDGGFDVSGDGGLEIDELSLDFADSGSVILAVGTDGDPVASPTIVLSDVDATSGINDVAFDLTDVAFSAISTTVHDSASGVVGTFSFGTISLLDVSVLDPVDCGVDLALTGSTILTAEGLTIERAGCTGLSVVTTDTASATITDSIFSDNFGGMVVQNFGTGTIELVDSTISGSTGEEQFTAFALTGLVRVTSSTISGGLDTGFPAISAFVDDGDVVIEHSTVTGNAVSAAPVVDAVGSCGCSGPGSFALDHTIVAGNPGTGLGAPDLLIESDVPATVNWSLIGDVDPADTTTLAAISAGSGNRFDASSPIDPDLGALALNGGSTPNHLPNATSPVINAGDPAISSPPATDQRDAARISGGIIDIGSVEVQFTPTLLLSRVSTAVGDQITASGAGLPANTVFTMVFNSTPVTLGTASSNASGSLSFSFTVPTSVPAGSHSVTATLAGNVVASAAITVTGLPATGLDTAAATLVGALLLLTGAASVALRRRRS